MTNNEIWVFFIEKHGYFIEIVKMHFSVRDSERYDRKFGDVMKLNNICKCHVVITFKAALTYKDYVEPLHFRLNLMKTLNLMLQRTIEYCNISYQAISSISLDMNREIQSLTVTNQKKIATCNIFIHN